MIEWGGDLEISLTDNRRGKEGQAYKRWVLVESIEKFSLIVVLKNDPSYFIPFMRVFYTYIQVLVPCWMVVPFWLVHANFLQGPLLKS